MKNIAFIFITAFMLFSSCKKDGGKTPPIVNSIDLDGNIINDSSLTHPENFLLSASIPNPTALDLDKPVIIAVHGFSATTFEWIELRDLGKKTNAFYTSIILLGGHGRDYSDFKKASWEDWQAPIIEEYNKLRSLGYQNIHFIGSSTGCPLLIDVIHNSKINSDVLKNVFLIDPIIVPSNKTLSVVSVAGPMISYTTSKFDTGENGFWYKYRPYQALKQLNILTKKVRKAIEKGIDLPSNVKMTVYKSENDESADPSSAPIIEKGIKHADGTKVKITMVKSSLHVFTRLKGRDAVTTEDIDLQHTTFTEIQSSL
ncbi:MAG: esterase [Flavobacteriia bacterium]|nr:esterase [Flavobacteriia bacterium]